MDTRGALQNDCFKWAFVTDAYGSDRYSDGLHEIWFNQDGNLQILALRARVEKTTLSISIGNYTIDSSAVKK